MPPKRASTSAAPAMAQAAIRQLVADSITTALEVQATNMANADNTNRNPELREAPVARKCSYKEFMSCQPFNFKGSEGAVGLIYWFECAESVFSCSNCIEDYKVKFSTDSEKMMKAFIEGLPRSIKGNVTASKPQTLKEAINIAQKLMDQVTKYHARIICDEKVVHIPIDDKTLIIRGDRIRQVEFKIDLIPGAVPVARTPYRLAPSEMQELSQVSF
uniref:Reverse transcriptase domain-containing protein n=1 Tax=Tanacetum cinerariifolium TaxID=118510 RepID=A0A6L2MYD2_TANCI|nr:reverse transcriptase domain-containing protein [Tanacetum cinerariifolium]